MLRIRRLSALFLIAVSYLLQGITIAVAQVPGTVSGTVHYGDTGQPASGIRIWLTPAEPNGGIHLDPKTGEYVLRDQDSTLPGTQVADDGTFTLPNVPVGSYLVHTYSASYISPDNTIYPTSNTAHVATGPSPASNALRIEVVANQPTKPVDVVLQRGGVIEGFVRSPPGANGGPEQSVAGFAANAERKIGTNSYAGAGGAAHTDARGYYRLEGLAPGEYIVFLGMGEGLPIYAEATMRPSEASVIRIEHAETQHLDIYLPNPSGLHRIEGSVKFDGPNPADVLVRLFPLGEGGLTATSPLSPEGGFSFRGVPDGDYTIAVDCQPTSEIVSVDVQKKLIHGRMIPCRYATATKDIHVFAHDITDLLMTPMAK